MNKPVAPSISLTEAKELVSLLEQGKDEEASSLLETLSMRDSLDLFAEVGKLTRQLHDSLNNFQVDPRIADLAKEDIPDAAIRLSYVIETTEKAANQTMDAVESSMPIAERLEEDIAAILPEWNKLMTRQIQLSEFKALCHKLDSLLTQANEDSSKLNSLMTEVLMAQGFQDITGQVIRRVIALVKEVEDSLVEMLTAFGDAALFSQAAETKPKSKSKSKQKEDTAEGPIINPEERDDVVSGQDGVDDLLSSLGF
jgi:chemotaxis protein CheZ